MLAETDAEQGALSFVAVCLHWTAHVLMCKTLLQQCLSFLPSGCGNECGQRGSKMEIHILHILE